MKGRKKWFCICMVMLISCAASLAAYAAGDEYEDVTLSPYFSIESTDPSNEKFPLKETNVVTNINGVISETFVTQTYTNEGDHPINASYLFPASTRVSVHGMTMDIGDKRVTAKIKEREEAKAEYEEAKSEGKSASLLEQQRPNVFSMDISNVMPGDVVRIELHYSELISLVDGTYQFAFPTVVGPRYMSPSEDAQAETNQFIATPYLKEDVTPPGKYNITVNLSAGVPIDSLTCKSHQVNISKDSDTTAKITLSNPENFAGNKDFILDYKLKGQEVTSGIMLGKGEKENFFMMMVQPPKQYQLEDIPSREYIFVLDISGSMMGYPLDTAKGLIKNLVGGLRETDSFNVILFSGGAAQMAPTSVPANAANIKNAIDMIDNENGGGGTELLPALEQAVSIPRTEGIARSIITLTDGYISGEREVFEFIDNNLNTTNFFSFGIGDSVNRYLIDGIAKTGLGEPFIVTGPEDAKTTAEKFRTYIQAPLLTDIQVSYEGFDVYDVEPKNMPTLFAERPIVVYGKWRGEPSGTIHLTGKTSGADYTKDIPVSSITPLESNNVIRYLWARTKVERLTDYGGNTDHEEEVKKEVTALGLEYSMMTPYTSFIAVLDEIRNKEKNAEDVTQPLPLPSNVSELAVGNTASYSVGSEPEGTMLILVAIAALLAIALYGTAKNKQDIKKG